MSFEKRIDEMLDDFNKILKNAESKRDSLTECYKTEGRFCEEMCKHLAEKDVLDYIKKNITASVKYNHYHHC